MQDEKENYRAHEKLVKETVRGIGASLKAKKAARAGMRTEKQPPHAGNINPPQVNMGNPY